MFFPRSIIYFNLKNIKLETENLIYLGMEGLHYFGLDLWVLRLTSQSARVTQFVE